MEDPDPEAKSWPGWLFPQKRSSRDFVGPTSERVQEISKITKSAGAHPVFVQEISDLGIVQCCVAVAVTGPIPHGIGIQAIRNLKAKGFKS